MCDLHVRGRMSGIPFSRICDYNPALTGKFTAVGTCVLLTQRGTPSYMVEVQMPEGIQVA